MASSAAEFSGWSWDGSSSGAKLSPDGHYRYLLWRVWDAERPLCGWIMLNPSRADAAADDPTLRRCRRFSLDWGFGGLLAGNLFAWRTAHPAELRMAPDPCGPGNDAALVSLARAGLGRLVCAWGEHGAWRGAASHALQLVHETGAVQPCCLALTRTGMPRHPLYVRADCQPQPLLPI